MFFVALFRNFDAREGGVFLKQEVEHFNLFLNHQSSRVVIKLLKFVVSIRALLDCSEWIVVISVRNFWGICVGQPVI